MNKSFILLALLCISAFSQTNSCPGYAAKDLINTGKFALMNMGSQSPDHVFNATISYPAPSWGFDVAATTGAIGDYSPLPGYGYNYFIDVSKHQTISNGIKINLIMLDDKSWTTLQVSWIATSRQDVTVGNFQLEQSSWVPATANVYSITYKTKRQVVKGNYKVAVFISGFSTTDNQFSLIINKKSYSSDTKSITVSFYSTSNPQMLTASFTYVVYPEIHVQLDFSYDLVPRGEVGAYQITGPVNFQPNKRIQYNQWRVQNRYMPCNGPDCTGMCELRENCITKGGNIYQGQCTYCPSGVVFEFGRCSKRCGPNQLYINRGCVCARGYTVNGKDCVLDKTCPTGKIWSDDKKGCVCDNGYYGAKCDKCPDGADSSADKSACVCRAADKYYDLYSNQCKSRCEVNQQWSSGKCICIPTHCWWNKVCRKCPDESDANPTQDSCICKSSTSYYDPEANVCVKCGAGQILNDKKNGCTCPAGFTFDQGSCVPICKIDQYLTSAKVCQCKPGLQKDVNGVCKNKCSNTQTWNGKSCSCLPGFARYDKVCKKCPAGSDPNALQTQCVCSALNQLFTVSSFTCTTCPSNSLPNAQKNGCVCVTGYISKGGQCVPDCKDTELFDVISGKCNCRTAFTRDASGVCVPRCSGTEEWNGNVCVCPAGSAKYTTCKACPSNALPNDIRTACICKDSNQIFNVGTFSCVSCQAYSSPSSDLTKCVCNENFVSTGSACVLNCGANEQPNLAAGRCDCAYGYTRVSGKCTPRCTKVNQEWNGSKCVCKANYGYWSGVCTLCPQNSNANADRTACKCISSSFAYNPNTFKCDLCPTNSRASVDQTKCVCNSGYQSLSDSCVPICGSNEQLNKQTKECECKVGFIRIGDQCQNRCGLNQQWSVKDNKCLCKENFVFSTGVCRDCGPDTEGTNYPRTTCICKDKKQLFNIPNLKCANLPDNSVLNDDYTDFKCLLGYLKVANACNNPCPSGASPNQAGVCVCGAGFYLDGNLCKKTVACPDKATWNSTKLVCVCDNKAQFLIQGKCQTCKQFSTYSPSTAKCVCATGYFLIGNQCKVCDAKTTYNGNDCLCNVGYFGNRDKCDKCHESCATCTGPQANQCTMCSDVALVLEKGYCTRKGACDPGSFVGETGCQKCIDNCLICPSVLECNQCALGYRVQKADYSGQQVQSCVEICGDGIRYEQQCDDGNTVDGDGCSKDCKVEKLWTCTTGSTLVKSKCSKHIPDQTVLTSKGIVNLGSRVVQMVRASYLPTCLTDGQCQNCFKVLKVNVINATVPITVKVSFVAFSQYQFLIEYDFGDLYVTSAFRTVIKLNPEFLGCLNEEDYNYQIDMVIDPTTLILVSVNTELTIDEIDNPNSPPKITLPNQAAEILGVKP